MHDRDLAILVSMSQQLEAGTPLADGLHLITDSALQLLGADHASLRVCDEAAGELKVVARSGVGVHHLPPPFRMGEGLMGWVARTGRSARVADCQRDPRFRSTHKRGYEVGSLMSLPLRSGERVRGVLSVSSSARNAFDVRDEQLVRLLCHLAAQALQLDELRGQVRTDRHEPPAPRIVQDHERACRQRPVASRRRPERSGSQQLDLLSG